MRQTLAETGGRSSSDHRRTLGGVHADRSRSLGMTEMQVMTTHSKIYLGDGVCAESRDDRSIVLTTDDGVRTTNTIVLEPEVFESLQRFVASLNLRHAKSTSA